MSEGTKIEPLINNPAVRQFNEIVMGVVNKGEKQIGQIAGIMSAEEQIAVDNWLAKPETQDFLTRLDKKNRQTLGLVWQITDTEKQIQVSYIDQYGMRMGFVYSPGTPMFSEALNGFQVGDIILIKSSQGVTFESVKPVTFSGKTKTKVFRRFRQILEKKIRKPEISGKKLPKEIGEEEKEE